MNNATNPRGLDHKPKRENFQTDDDFGEAYAIWRSQQGRVAASAPVVKAQPQAAKPPAIPPASAPAPALARPTQPRRSEAEREAWNLSTKERFWRAKTSASGSKAK